MCRCKQALMHLVVAQLRRTNAAGVALLIRDVQLHHPTQASNCCGVAHVFAGGAAWGEKVGLPCISSAAANVQQPQQQLVQQKVLLLPHNRLPHMSHMFLDTCALQLQ
jgi:hypothetical protein